MYKTILPSLKLNNGLEMPTKGLGTWLNDNFEEILETSIQLGYRLIDTAKFYKNEHLIGSALQKIYQNRSVQREDLFIVSKIWNNPDLEVAEQVEGSLKDLQTDYLDLVLVHWPFGIKNDDSTNCKQVPLHIFWKKLEEEVKKGRVKSIGVSNFNCQLILDLLSYAEIKPVVNQIELHPYLTQNHLVDFCQRFGIQITAYSPLCRGGQDVNKSYGYVLDLFNEPILKELSIKYNKSIAEIVLNWHLSRGVAIIPKSQNPERIKQNFECDNFIMSKEDLEQISSLNKNLRTIDPMNGLKLMENFPIFE